MKVNKKTAIISWVVFNVLWVLNMNIIEGVEGVGLAAFKAVPYIMVMTFGMYLILFVFNFVYFLLHRTKNYLAMLVLTIIFISLGLIAFLNS